MVEYIRNCSKRVGEVEMITESAQIGMRNRALAAEDAGAEKRRKVGNGELKLPSSTFVQITTEEDSHATVSHGGDHVSVSCCFSNGSPEELRFTDLKEIVELETDTGFNLNTRASKQKTDFKAGSSSPETTITSKSSTTIKSRRTFPPEKTPPAAELEEFFASAEKNLHKRFKNKYNYDIVNDTPLEGRFEWFQVEPKS